jgi:hypothetical protein
MIAFGVFDRIVTGMVLDVSPDIQFLPLLVQQLLLALILMCKFVELPLVRSKSHRLVTIRLKLNSA